MKTRNNVRKAANKTLAVIISLVLLSFTVQAQDFWKSVLNNNSFNQIAMAMVDNTETNAGESDGDMATTANMFAEYLVEESEEALEVEDWMMNDANFYSNLSLEAENEGTLELEDWMFDAGLFSRAWEALEYEAEEALELEEWMTNDNTFRVRTMVVVQEADESLELEPWMVNEKVWKF